MRSINEEVREPGVMEQQLNNKEYSPKAILALASAILNDAEAFSWLMSNQHKELAALIDVLVFGKKDALKWLVDQKRGDLCLFIDALEENEQVILQMMTSRTAKPWAATAQFVNGNDSAEDFLLNYYPHFRSLGNVLIRQYNRNTNGDAIGGFDGRPGSIL